MVLRFTLLGALALAGSATAAPKGTMDGVVQTAVAAAVTREARPDDLIRTAGKPDADYVYRALAGEIDLFVQKQDNGAVAAQLTRGEETKRRVVELRVLEWHGKECSCSAILLFNRDGKFLYGMVPVSGSEDSVDDLKNRHADAPRQLEIAGPGVRARMFAYPDRGVGYVATGPGPFAFKVVFPYGTKSRDFRGAIPPSPAPKGGSNVRAPAVASPPPPTPPPRRAAPQRR